MAQGLSEEEFQRMQAQLLELRTANYQLKDQCKKYESELSAIKTASVNRDKELQRVTKLAWPAQASTFFQAINKSKKAKDVEQLLLENESLQRKLQSQEEDFRLQNSTLMEELGKLCTANEDLEKAVGNLRQNQTTSTESVTVVDPGLRDEVRRLQALNAALQKNLNSTQEQLQAETLELQQKINYLSQTNAELEHQCTKLLGDRPAPAGSDVEVENSESALEPQSPLEKALHDLLDNEWDVFMEDVKLHAVTSDFSDDLIEVPDAVTVLQGHAKQLKTRLSGALARNMENLAKFVTKDEEDSRGDETDGQVESNPSKLSISSKEMTELQLKLDTEKEEKNLLKEQMQQTEQLYKAEIAALKEEVEKITEKAKKKQESLVQLQNEKEGLYSKSRKQLDEVNANKDREIESLKRDQNRLHAEIAKLKEGSLTVEEKYQQRIKELEGQVSESTLQSFTAEQVATTEAEKDLLMEELTTAQKNLHAKTDELKKERELKASIQSQHEDLEIKYTTLLTERDELQGQLNECLGANSKLGDQLREVQNDRHNLHRDLQEANKVAEKRKSMLDDLAIQNQTLREQHNEEVSRLQGEHQVAMDDLKQQLQYEKKRRKELEPLKDRLADMEGQLESLENTKGWFERSFHDSEEQITKLKEEHVEEIKRLEEVHEQACVVLREEVQQHKNEIAEKELELSQAEEKSQELLVTIDNLKVTAKDRKAEKKLTEKKGAGMVKDLQRQVRQEKKRADKLQERLQEIITHGIAHGKGLEDLLREPNYDDRQKLDTSSLSSWGTGTGTRDTSDYTPSPENSQAHNNSSLSEETTELIGRLTELQQKNWALEEKVRHLEESTSCMAEDLLNKSAIIETHVMERKLVDPGKSSGGSPSADKRSVGSTPLNKLKDFMTLPRDDHEGMKEMNQKLQIMLEETLTKNMHLQKDIEMLSREVVRLSRIVGSSSGSSPSTPDVSSKPVEPALASQATASSSS